MDSEISGGLPILQTVKDRQLAYFSNLSKSNALCWLGKTQFENNIRQCDIMVNAYEFPCDIMVNAYEFPCNIMVNAYEFPCDIMVNAYEFPCDIMVNAYEFPWSGSTQ